MTTQLNQVSVFLSYAHEDEFWLKELEKHLSLLKRRKVISTWYCRQIVPGTNWPKTIDQQLEQASIILLLVSADFLASDYCYEVEMTRALELHESGRARVIPIAVRPTDWKDAPFARLNALPTNAKAITTWSNRDEACVDVVMGIRLAIGDLSLSPASPFRTTLPSIWNIPYPRNFFFTGRDDLLLRLRKLLQEGQATALSQSPQAISGLGGIGKTQIAVEYAYRYSQEYRSVLWARAESQEALNSSYATIATLLKLPEQANIATLLKLPEQGKQEALNSSLTKRGTSSEQAKQEAQEITIQAVKTWLQTHGEWLLILDNADDLDQLEPFLPKPLRGHILITTRAWDMQRLATRLEVEALPDEQGAWLLLQRAGLLVSDAELSQVSLEDRQLATQLTQELGGLPLALDQVGAYLEATGMGLNEYHRIYQTRRQALVQERRSRIPDHPDSVATTWTVSFQQVEKKNDAAADLLRFCAYLAPNAIPEAIIKKGAKYLGPRLEPIATDPLLFAQAVEALRGYSLLSRDPRTVTLSMHRLVQAILRDQMAAEDEKLWKRRAVQAVNAASPDVQDVEQWDYCDQWVPHVLECATWIRNEQLYNEENASLLNKAGYYLDDRARYSEAEVLYQLSLTIRKQVLGATHYETASSLTNLGLLYRNQEKYAEAELLLTSAWKIYEQSLAAEHPDTFRVDEAALTLNNLALLYYDQEKYAVAEPLYERVFEICKQWLGAEHPTTALILNNLGALYVRQKKYAEAEPLLEGSLAIRERLGAEHPDTAQSLNNLAVLYEKQEKYAVAEPLLKRSLRIYEQRLGKEHPTTEGRSEKYKLLLQKMKSNAEIEDQEES